MSAEKCHEECAADSGLGGTVCVTCAMECGSPDGSGVGGDVECSACLVDGMDRDGGRTFPREMISDGSMKVWMMTRSGSDRDDCGCERRRGGDCNEFGGSPCGGCEQWFRD